MRCSDVLPQLADYLAGLLAEPVREAICEHLDTCEGCLAESDSLEPLFGARRSRTQPPAPEFDWALFSVEINERIDRKSTAVPGALSYLLPVVTAALLLFIVSRIPEQGADLFTTTSSAVKDAAGAIHADALMEIADMQLSLGAVSTAAVLASDAAHEETIAALLQDDLSRSVFPDAGINEMLAAGMPYLDDDDLMEIAGSPHTALSFSDIDLELSDI